MKTVFLAIPLLVLAASAQARDIKAEIDAANAKFVAAFDKGDAAAIGQFYTERATALPPGAPMAKGRAAIQAFWQGAIQAGVRNISLKALQVDQFAKIRTRPIKASGSYLGCLTSKRTSGHG